MPKKILEVTLEELAVRHDGDEKSTEVGDNTLIAQLLFSRTLVSDVLVSTRSLDLWSPPKKGGGQFASYRGKTLGERLLFKKWVEGPAVGLKIEVTDKDSAGKVSKFFLDLASGLAGAGGSALKTVSGSIPFSGLAVDAAVSFARGAIEVESDKASQDRIFSLGEAWIDIPTARTLAPSQIHRWTEVQADLVATQNLNKLVYVREPDPISSKPRWRVRPDRKIVIKKGEANGSVRIAYRVYEED